MSPERQTYFLRLPMWGTDEPVQVCRDGTGVCVRAFRGPMATARGLIYARLRSALRA